MLTIALAQMRCAVGDITRNAQRMAEWAIKARDTYGAHLIAFPELALTGYPPEDLLLRTDFVGAARRSLQDLIQAVPGIDMLIGLPWAEEGALYNACAWVSHQKVVAVYRKQVLPNYGVFDERRYFTPGHTPLVRGIQGMQVGVTICEDLWEPEPMRAAVTAGARIVVNINASPYHKDKDALRLAVARTRIAEGGAALVYVNMVGGQDELVFDGNSFALEGNGEPPIQAAAFQEDLAVATFQDTGHLESGIRHKGPQGPGALYEALKLGLRDYVLRNGFEKMILGLSGGIDSALTLALCGDAVPEIPLQAVMMPSPYTHAISIEDAQTQARTQGVDFSIVPIDDVYESFAQTLKGLWTGPGHAVAAENLQARIRGTLLMAIANAHQGLVIVTSNKSEIAVGYTTLYGDMAGGYAPLKDVFKTDVYALARYRNSLSPVIPARVLKRPPTAELRFDQKDTDSLPAYDLLDPILAAHIEQDLGREELILNGFNADLVEQVLRLVRLAEHKRRQAPIGTRVTMRGFGRDWRYPVSSAYNAPSK